MPPHPPQPPQIHRAVRRVQHVRNRNPLTLVHNRQPMPPPGRTLIFMAPCSWTLPDCGCGGCLAELNPTARARAAGLASLTVWGLTGRRYGLCEITVMPCSVTGDRDYRVYPVALGDLWGGGGPGFYPMISDGVWHNVGACSCCASGCEVDLPGPTTKANVVEVKVGGVVVAAAAYQIHDGHLLVRVDGGCWPSCVNFAATPPDFTVKYRRGETVPAPVLAVTATLACEFGRACAGVACRLPNRVSSLTRQGVDVQFADLTELFEAGLTGIDEVDRIILTVNPGRRAERPQVYSPDLPAPRMVT